MATQTFPQKYAITDEFLSATAPVSARVKLQQDREEFQGHLKKLQQLNISVCKADIEKEVRCFFLKEMEILRDELLRFLKNVNIVVYDRTEVHTYLGQKSREMYKSNPWFWVWRPLRESDAFPDSSYRDIPEQGDHGKVIWKQYDRMLPEAVLYTIEKITAGFSRGRLFVSDFEEQKQNPQFASRPDPFLAVAVPWMPFLIVDFWNEPGFHPTRLEEFEDEEDGE